MRCPITGVRKHMSYLPLALLNDQHVSHCVACKVRGRLWLTVVASHVQEVMSDPAVCGGDGLSNDRFAISEWLEAHDVSHVTKAPLVTRKLIPNRALRSVIEATLWRQ